MPDIPTYKFIDRLRPACSRCGRPLLLTHIEPEEPGFDLRTYYCAFCKANETVIANI
jgi:ribosomal protein S27AE